MARVVMEVINDLEQGCVSTIVGGCAHMSFFCALKSAVIRRFAQLQTREAREQ